MRLALVGFNIPIGQVVPDKVTNLTQGLAKPVFAQGSIKLRFCLLESPPNPVVGRIFAIFATNRFQKALDVVDFVA